MKNYRIALYPGDGIGKEVLPEAVRVLECVEQNQSAFRLQTTEFPWGCDYHAKTGKFVPDGFLDELLKFDAIFLGAVGDPNRSPDALTLAPLVQIRQRFDQYVCMRPAVLWPGVRSPLVSPGKIDLIVLRENSEGEYLVCGGRAKQGQPDEVAVQSAIHTRKGVERILRFGFKLAQERRSRLTMITKSNALVFGMVLWDDVFRELRGEFPDVETQVLHADAAAMDFVRRPADFDVVVASNLFGDILSDLAGIISGGLGLAPSANINPERRYPSMFEPVHGSAPDIAGRGAANPIAAILSGALMLDWLGQGAAANVVRSAVEATLACDEVTRDLGGTLSTHEATNCVIQRILNSSERAMPQLA